jgi:N-methylhydantoinase B/oxoprolinase/acetone carboxylase alpha subunit
MPQLAKESKRREKLTIFSYKKLHKKVQLNPIKMKIKNKNKKAKIDFHKILPYLVKSFNII